MIEPSRACFLAAAVPFLVLGVAHALATPMRAGDRKGLSPLDASLIAHMARTRLLLTPEVDVWSGWVGFNLSHSLGAVMLGLVTLGTGFSAEVFALNAPVFLPLCLLLAGTYLMVGLRYWFRVPIAGITVSFVLFGAAMGLWLVGM